MNTASDFEYFPSSSPICIQQQQLLPALLPPPPSSDAAAAAGCQIQRFHQQPRKKRSKVIRVDRPVLSADPCFPRPKPARKPDPGAPKITRPCTECGKKFWSWKALFGHMRCHPERQWRGINPPAKLQRPTAPSGEAAALTEEDHDVAASLLMLANGPSAPDSSATGKPAQAFPPELPGPFLSDETAGTGDDSGASGRFECSSCRKVFGSHQALGGHRASHKNVKGCFAITRNEGDEEEDCGETLLGLGEEPASAAGAGSGQHKCVVCMKIFSSGQALGGHKRCHWEKGGEDHHESLTLLAQLGSQDRSAILSPREGFCGLDLNLPAAPSAEETSSSSYSSGLALDLRLGI